MRGFSGREQSAAFPAARASERSSAERGDKCPHYPPPPSPASCQTSPTPPPHTHTRSHGPRKRLFARVRGGCCDALGGGAGEEDVAVEGGAVEAAGARELAGAGVGRQPLEQAHLRLGCGHSDPPATRIRALGSSFLSKLDPRSGSLLSRPTGDSDPGTRITCDSDPGTRTSWIQAGSKKRQPLEQARLRLGSGHSDPAS